MENYSAKNGDGDELKKLLSGKWSNFDLHSFAKNKIGPLIS
jgi:hypothetical protein